MDEPRDIEGSGEALGFLNPLEFICSVVRSFADSTLQRMDPA